MGRYYLQTTRGRGAPPSSVAVGTPTLVQFVQTGWDTTTSYSGAPATTLQITAPNPTGAMNFLALGLRYNKALTIATVSDGTNTWAQPAALSLPATTSGTDKIDFWYTAGASSVQVVTVTFTGTLSGGAPSDVHGHLSEWFNVATSSAFDAGAVSDAGTSSPYTAGSFSAASSSDLILSYGFQISNGAGTLSALTAGAQGSGFSLMGADLNAGGATTNYGHVAQYQVWSGSGSITPGFSTTGNTTAGYGVLAVAFKAATAGTAPSASPRIVCAVHYGFNENIATPFQLPFPTSCNLIVGSWNSPSSGSGLLVSAATDSASNTWSFPSAANENVSGDLGAQIFYAGNATCSPTLHDFSMTFDQYTANGDAMLILYGVTGAATSPYDAGATIGGTLNGDNTTHVAVSSVTITPTTTQGIVFANIAISWNDVQSVSVSGQTVTFDCAVNAALDDGQSGDSPLDQDNGAAHVYHANTSAETFVWTANTGYTPSPGMGSWAAIAAAFTG